MGLVYKARQISLDRLVALKMLPLGALATKEQVLRFRTEAAAAGSLQHPNIVAIHEVGLCEDQHYLVMDFVEGQTLAELARAGPLPPPQAARYVQKVAEAIHYAHERGILHRDLKPSNVLIDAADEPRITDFGLAKRLESVTDLTLSGQVLGSPQYMPPEQAAGRQRQVGRHSDVYSLGAILYHLLTGRPPFVGQTLTDVLPQVLNQEPLRLRQLNPAAPADLETLCLKCLEKEMHRRYPSALALAEGLGRVLRGEPIVARPVGLPGKAWRWCRRKPQVATTVAIALLAALVGLLGITREWRRAEAGELVARQNAYAADMKEVQRAIEDSDLGRARELLDRYRPVDKSEIRNPKPESDLRGWEWRYFWSQCRSEEWFTLWQYSNCVTALAFSADGRWLAVRQHEGMVTLWDANAKRAMLKLAGNDNWEGYKALAFSPRGTLLARGRRDTNGTPLVIVHDVSARKEIASWPLSTALRSVAFSPDAKLIAALSQDGSVRVCEIASQQVVTQFLTGTLDFRRSVYTGSNRQWTASNLLVLHYGGVLFSPDGRWLAVGEARPRIRLFDLTTGQERPPIIAPKPGDGISALAFSPDGHLLAAGCGTLDHNIHVWDLVDGTEIPLAGHSGWVTALAFSPDGHTLASASGDQTIRLWDVARQAERRRFQGSADEIWALVWSPDGKAIVTGGRDGSVQYWDPAAKPGVASYSVLPARIFPYALSFLPDSKSFLTVVDPEGGVQRWDTASLQQAERLSFLGTNHRSVGLSSDGHWLALGDARGNVQVWDLPARRLATNLLFKGAVVGDLFFSPHDHILACGAISPVRPIDVKLWKAPGWEEIDLSSIDLKGLGSGALSPDGRMIALGYDGKAAWWDLATGKKEAEFDCHGPKWGVASLAFSPDGKVFAAAGDYGGVTLWDMASRKPRFISRAFRNLLRNVAFSPDGRRLIASGSSPHEVLRLWDVQTGRDVATLPGEPRSYNLFVSPDGNTLCAVSIDDGLGPAHCHGGRLRPSRRIDGDVRHRLLRSGHVGRHELHPDRRDVGDEVPRRDANQ